jgi:hypothetical protein
VFHVAGYDHYASYNLSKYKDLITDNGGVLTDFYDNAVTHLVVDDFRNTVVDRAREDRKLIVTLQWVRDVVVVAGKYRPPWEFLHVPPLYRVGKDEPFAAAVGTVCWTGFRDDDRERLRRILRLTGAVQSLSLGKKISTLICRTYVFCLLIFFARP